MDEQGTLEQVNISFSRFESDFKYIVFHNRETNSFTNIYKFLNTSRDTNCGFKLVVSSKIKNSDRTLHQTKGQAFTIKSVSFERIYWLYNTSLLLVTKLTFLYSVGFTHTNNLIINTLDSGLDFIKIYQSPFNLYYAPFDQDSSYYYYILAENSILETLTKDKRTKSCQIREVD